jgi:hypothetical protein
LTWAERNRTHLDNIRSYLAGFQSQKPSVFRWFTGGEEPIIPLAPESDRGIALLLCFSALYQGITEPRLMRLLAGLWREYGPEFLRLNKLPFEALQARIDAEPGLQNWSIRKQSPGILRSACDFFHAHGRLLPWARSIGNGEECVRILCDEIFMMGKTSAFKSKPRYFLWLLTQLPGTEPEGFWGRNMLLPITPGHLRFVREFGPLHGKKRSPWTTPEEKLDYVNRFFRLLAPGAPWSVYSALDAYLKPGAIANALKADASEKVWECRRILGGCLQCPMAALCPGREET